MALKWGIVTTGFIAHDFVNAVSTLPADDHEVVAVAARDKSKAEEFAATHGIPRAYGGYEAIAKDPEVEAVYVAALNPAHYEISMMMLEHGKHVLCEKPLCMNEREARKLITFAESKKLFLMEAIWSRFFPSYQYLKRQIDSGTLGEIQEVNVTFGFHIPSERVQLKKLGGGTVLDLGVYTIQVSQWAFREPPKEIKATGELNADGVDIGVKAELIYSRGVARIQTSASTKLKNEAVIVGTKGQITLNDTFWCPISLTDIDGSVKTWPLPPGRHPHFNFPNSCGLRYEAEEVRKCIRGGLLQSDVVSHNESLVIAKIQDEIRRQIGVKYDADDQ
ncbi:trans-1,2-dihydrobenzene-1,2-diol dehydrogenase-like [Phlebotomus argentipes]|uniref:trans-1,2-dihydrobenzene-1,2-diol dehydrogenase-like n=1 Tax=Phlebotomus argentipes TaxID=94469 RepID=UPI002892F8A7|nr:trans-1,2-dihydrobenzene-1,2-diol dehydrogenase-like [Phlebotomus argentipes]